MPPKRMPKVTSLSSSSTSRGRNANPFGPVDPNSYNDYDEAMQDGVELEEKGERFQFGPKAQRFYVQAGTLYTRSAYLAGTNVQQRADALYNAARIQFLLATQFALPPENLQLLTEAINAAQQAVQLAPPLPASVSSEGALPNPFTLDTMTHLATSLQTLAEAVDELGWPQGLQTPVTMSQGPQQAPKPALLWQQALELFQQVADGQNVILQDQKSAATVAADPDTDALDSEPSLDTEADEEAPPVDAYDAADVYGYTSSLVTPASLMETLLSMIACFTSLIEAATTIEEIQACSAAIEQIVARAQTTAGDSTATLEATSNSTSQASSEVVARMEEVQRSSLLSRITCLMRAVDLGSETSQISGEIESAMQKVNDWASRLVTQPAPSASNEAGRDRKEGQVATLCDVGEAGLNLCRLSLRFEPAEAGVAAIWALATVSTKLFSQALAALDTSAAGGGSAAVLGQANTSTPTSRARCRILLALSSFSIFRSHPVFEAAGIAGAKGTRGKLVDNARLYARKAVSEIGLGFLLRPAPKQAAKNSVVPPSGGWESLSLESETTLHLLRALLYRANVNAEAADVDPKAASEMQSELDNVIQHVAQLRTRPTQVGATAATASVELAQWLYSQGAKSFVDSVVDDNGRNIVQHEIVWWEKLFSNELAIN